MKFCQTRKFFGLTENGVKNEKKKLQKKNIYKKKPRIKIALAR